MTKCKESWIDGYRKGVSERIESACFEAVNVEILAQMAEENERLQAEVLRLNNALELMCCKPDDA